MGENMGSSGATRDPQLGLYKPAGWGSHWRAARNGAGAGKAKVAIVGDSICAGYYSSNLDTKGWTGLVAADLRSRYGDGGSGWKGVVDTATFMTAASIAAGVQTFYTSAGNIVAQAGTWVHQTSFYGPNFYYIGTQTAGSTATFVVRGTTAYVYTLANSGSNAAYTYTVDGGAPVSVADAAPFSIQKTTISGLSSGAHTIVITYNGDGAKFLYLNGVSAENATGVVVNKFTRYGAASAAVNNNDALTNCTWNGGSNYPADLAIYGMGCNDASGGVTGDAWAKNARRWISSVRGSGTLTGESDILLILSNPGKYDETNYLYQDYASRARGIAEAYGAALIDFGRWAGTAGTIGTGSATGQPAPRPVRVEPIWSTRRTWGMRTWRR